MSNLHKHIRRACIFKDIKALEQHLGDYDALMNLSEQRQVKFNDILCSAIDTCDFSAGSDIIIPMILARCGNLKEDHYVWLSIDQVKDSHDRTRIRQWVHQHQLPYDDGKDCVII